jgi:hypothetical protein
VNAEGSTICTCIRDDSAALGVDLSFCIVNTNGRDHLLRCLAAVRDTAPEGRSFEVLVLDNASDDGSAEAAREWIAGHGGERWRVFEQPSREGKAANDTLLLQSADGELCLLLNEDAELNPGAVEALAAALEADPEAAAAGAQLLDPDGNAAPCAWRLPSVWTALAGALFMHKAFVTQSRAHGHPRRVGWAQSSALLVRRTAAEQVGWLDERFFVYSDETDFCKRLRDAGWEILQVPAARAIHHEQLATDRSAGDRRVVEFHRNRDLYMRKHHGPLAAAIVRALTAWSYVPRALAALVLPGHDPRWYLLHARQALGPRGEGLRELAEKT